MLRLIFVLLFCIHLLIRVELLIYAPLMLCAKRCSQLYKSIMNKNLLLILFSLLIFKSYAQNDSLGIKITLATDKQLNLLHASKINIKTTEKEAKEFAVNDIENSNLFLIIRNPMTFSIDQLEFEKRFNIFYLRKNIMSDVDIKKIYNFEVLNFIKEKYGNESIERISENVIGIDEWKSMK